MLDGQKTVRRGDVVLGFASSGLHTNGYALARKILFDQLRFKPTTRIAELGRTVREELRAGDLSYDNLVQALLRKCNPPHGPRATRSPPPARTKVSRTRTSLA